MKRVLITGAAGFIGSNALEVFANDPEYKAVACIDSLTYASDRSRVDKFGEQLRRNSGDNIYLYVFDIGLHPLDYLLNRIRPDVIINYAASSHVDRSIEDATTKEFVLSNYYGALNIVNSTRKYQKTAGQKVLIVQVSTDETLSDTSIDSTEEFKEDQRLNPNNLYSSTKAAAEQGIQALHHTYNDFDYVIVRATNNYGPNQHFEKFIPTVIRKAYKNEKIPVYGTGGNIREWLWVGDFVDGVRKTIHKYLTGGLNTRILHFGSGVRKTNIEVVKTILSLMDKKEDLISYVPDRLGHDRRYALDCSKAKELLGWKAKKDFEEGLCDVIKDVTERIKQNDGK